MSMAPPARISPEDEDWLGRIRDGSEQENKNSEAMSREYMNQSKCSQESDYVCPNGGSEDNVPRGSSKRVAEVIDNGIEEDRGESLVNHFTYRRLGDGSISNIDATGTGGSHSSETTKEAGDFRRQAKANGYGETTAPDEHEEKRAGGGVMIGSGDEDFRELAEWRVSEGVRRNRTHDSKHTAAARKIQRKNRSSFPGMQGKMRMTSRFIQEHNCATKIQAVARGWLIRLENNALAEALKVSEDANKDVLAWSDRRNSVHVNNSQSFTKDEHAAAKRIQAQARRRFAIKHHGTGPSGQTEFPERDVVGYGKMSLKEEGTERGIHEIQGYRVTEKPNVKPVEIARRFQDPWGKDEAARCIQRQIRHKVTGVRKKFLLDCSVGGTGKSRATHRERQEGMAIPSDIGQNLEVNDSSETKRGTQSQEKLSKLNRLSKEAVEKRTEEAMCVRAIEEPSDAGSSVETDVAERSPPERSALRDTTGGTASTRLEDSHSPNRSVSPHYREGSRVNGRNSKGIEEVAHGHDFKGEGRDNACDEEKLKKARKQTQRYTRDRKARALAREEKSKRDLRVVQADLKIAEDLRAKQVMVERSELEAKRSRVLEDMKRRQRRLRRLQEQVQGCTSLASSTGGGVERQHDSAPTQDDSDSGRVSSEVAAFLPSLRPLRDLKELPRRKHEKYASKFRDRILEERRARMEEKDSEWKQREQKVYRQADYASKIREHAKRALAAEQRRLQARQRTPRADQFVDRTPVLIKKSKHEGGSGIFSYPPSRPILGPPKSGKGDKYPTGGCQPLGRVQKRLDTSEGIHQERSKASEARGKEVAPSHGSRYGRLSSGQRVRREEVEGDIPETESGGQGNRCSRRLAPLQKVGVRDGSTGGNRRANADKRSIAGEDIDAMYEERLASLERRLGTGGKHCR